MDTLEGINKRGGRTPNRETLEHTFRELLCAIFFLSIVLLGEDSAAEQMGRGDGDLYQFYTTSAFGELERPSDPIWLDTDRSLGTIGLKAEALLNRSILEEVCDETANLYLRDQPDLRTLADSAPEFCFRAAQVEDVLQRNNWTLTFHMKAWIRFAKAMNLKKIDLEQFLPTYTQFSHQLLGCIDVFKKMSPAFHAE